MKEMDGLIEEGNKEEAEELLPELMSVADKAAGNGPLHVNKASRIKSKYSRRVDELG
jgi:ribosomal protein S20